MLRFSHTNLIYKAFGKKKSPLYKNFFIPTLQMLESRETPSVSAVADSFTNISPYVPTVLNVLQNDVNPDGSGFTLIGNTSVTPAGPSLSQNPDGTFTFSSPNAGNFSFDYTISGKLHQLTSPDNSTTDEFGRSIAMSADGNTMIIGAPNDNIGSNIDQGSAYIFTKTPSGWVQQAQLVAPNPSAFDKFGSSVDITADGNTVVIQASSAVHSFSRSNSSWNLFDSFTTYYQSTPVAISDDGSTLLTSSQYAAFSIYQRSGSSWIPQADLQQSPSSANAPIDLSADGTTAIIGDFISNNSTGCVKVFSFSNNSWSQQTTLFASDSDSGDSFGSSVSISADGNTVAIGAPGHDTQNNPDQGAIYVFTRSNTNWSQSAELNYPNNNTSYQKFGASVSISADGNTILATDAQVQNYPFSTQNHTGVIFSKIANQWIPQANFPIPVSTYGYISDSAISTDGSTIAFAIPNLILSGITNSTLPNSVFSLSWAQSIASVQVQVGFQPTPIILGIFSDTGTSFSDGITNDNTISLNGVSTPGYTVDLYLGSQLLGTAPVDNSGLWFFDYSSTPLPDGLHSFTARANGPNNFSSAFSQPFHVTIDTIQPTASLESIQTPRNSPVASININFSEPVTGLDINDLTLSRNGSVINLQGASISGSGSAYSLSGISILTSFTGTYTLQLNSNNSGISDLAGNTLTAPIQISWYANTTPPSLPNRVQAVADSINILNINTPTVLNVLQNDVNPDGSGFTLIGNTSVTPAGPSLSQNPDGTFTFSSPNAGNFSFDYTISGKLHQLTSPDNSTTDEFGRSIAMSADGNTMIIGAPNDNIGSNIDQGSAYIFTKTPSGWVQQAQLVAPNPSAFDKFGSSVDITADGNTVVIQASSAVHSFSRSNSSWNLFDSFTTYYQSTPVAISDDGSTLLTSSQYAAFSIYQRSGSSWIPQADLQQSPSSANAPIDLSADGTTAIIGDFISNNSTGCVKVFSFSNNSWSQQTTLFASDSDSGDSFGSSVSISADGNTVAIGAPGHDTQNNPDQGAIYVFTRSNTNWSQSAELNYPNNNTSYQKFGASVSISADGNTILATDAQVQNYPFSTQNHTGVIFSKIANQWIPQANFPIPVSTYGYISDSAISTDGSTIAFAIPNLILSGITNSTLPNSVFSLSWAQSIASVQVQVGFQPTPIILGIFSDTGTSFSDGITNDNTISLNGVSTPGYTVDLYLGSQLLGTAPVDNSGLWFFDYSSTPLPDGLHSFTARANGPNNFSSAFSQPFHVTIDTIQPTASLESIQTPRNSPVASININFSEPVTGLDINDLTLSRNGSVINLQGASISGSGSAYSLSGISILTSFTGTYTLQLNSNNSGISDLAGNTLTAPIQISWYANTTPPSLPNRVQAVADSINILNINTPTVLNVLQNDVNPDGSGFTLIGNTSVTPAGPSLSQNPDGTFTFSSPNAGNFSFDYTISGKLHQLTSPDNSTTDEFGRSIAMSADGNTMIIGAPNDNIGSNIDQGSAYIFTKTPSGWVQQAQLVAPNPSAFDKFGSSVDITADGNTVVIQASSAVHSFSRSNSSWNLFDSFTTYYQSTPVAISDDGSTLLTSSQYAAFSIYQRSGSSWIPQADLQQSPSSANAPIDLSADGTTAIIGDFISNNSTGCVKVFSFSNNSWSQQTTLFASDSDSGDSFGSSVSISADGNTVAIGAPGHDTQNNPDQGAIYVFTRSNTNWSQSAELNYPNNNTSYQKFGASVSISADGNTILATDAQVQNYPFSTQNHTGVIFSKIANQWIPQANFPIPVSTYGYISDSAISTDGSTIAFAIPNLILSGITNSTLPNSVFSLSWAQSIASVQVQVDQPPSPPSGTAPTVGFIDLNQDGQTELINADSGKIKIVNPISGVAISEFVPFPLFQGDIRVQSGDFDGNGSSEIVAAAGKGGAPHIVVYDPLTNQVRKSFFAYGSGFRGGIVVAVGDINRDGIADIVTGTGPGGGPHIRIFSGTTNEVISEFMAYDPEFRGGVSVALADTNYDGFLDIITGAGLGGGPHVKVFDGRNGSLLQSFFAYSTSFNGGIYVAAGDIDGNGQIDIVTGTGSGGGPHVQIFDLSHLDSPRSFFAYASVFQGGVRIGLADRNNDGTKDIITGAGPGGSPHVKIYDGRTFALIDTFFAGSFDDLSGVNVN